MAKKVKSENMTLLEHLDELRRRLSVVFFLNFAGVLILFQFAPQIMQYLLLLNPGMDMVYLSPSELFLVYVQLSFLASFILCSPVTIYEIWSYVSRGLYKKEKIYIFVTLVLGLFFFAGGVYFCYKMVLPITLQFFVRIAHEDIRATISIKAFTSFVNAMLVCFGAVFEMPVISFLLSQLGVLKPGPLKKNRGIIMVVLAIVAAIITPPDVVSQMLLLAPMLLLFEVSVRICTIVDKRRTKRLEKAEKLENELAEV